MLIKSNHNSLKSGEEKIIQKVPTEEKVKHTILKKDDIFEIKEGKYTLIKIQTIVGSDVSYAVLDDGITLEVKKLSRSQYYFSLFGGATYVVDNKDRKSFACPKPNTSIMELDNKGKVIMYNQLTEGSCKSPAGVSVKYSYIKDILTRVRVRTISDCINECDERDVMRTEIHSYRYND